MYSRSPGQRREQRLGAALALLVLVAAGCGEMATPFQPDSSSKAGFDPSGAALPGPAPTEPVAVQRKPETVVIIAPAEDVSSSVLVRAKDGGVVVAGRHRLIIPPDALQFDTTIKLTDVTGSNGYVACEAMPEGLHFMKPVQLKTDFSDIRNPSGFTIFWVANPGKSGEAWIDTRATVSPDGTGLTTWLTHFSTYAPGKAGWGPRRGGPRNTNIEG